MDNKKNLSISIIAVIAIIILTFSGTYAYLASVTNESNVNTGSGKLDINYVGPSADSLTGNIISSDSRDSGIKTVATASLNAGSLDALFNMYITPTVITGLNITAFKWEVEGINGGTIVYTNSGNFANATAGTKIKIVDSYKLRTTTTTFNIYIWLDGDLVTDAISDASFKAEIVSDSVKITGEF